MRSSLSTGTTSRGTIMHLVKPLEIGFPIESRWDRGRTFAPPSRAVRDFDIGFEQRVNFGLRRCASKHCRLIRIENHDRELR